MPKAELVVMLHMQPSASVRYENLSVFRSVYSQHQQKFSLAKQPDKSSVLKTLKREIVHDFAWRLTDTSTVQCHACIRILARNISLDKQYAPEPPFYDSTGRQRKTEMRFGKKKVGLIVTTTEMFALILPLFRKF